MGHARWINRTVLLVTLVAGTLAYWWTTPTIKLHSHGDESPVDANFASNAPTRLGSDWGVFLSGVLRIPEGDRRMQLLAAEVARCGITEIEELLTRIALVEDPAVRVDLRRVVLATWSKLDGRAAMAYVMALPPGDRPVLLQEPVLENWAVKDPRAATEWLEGLKSAGTDPRLAKALGNALSRQGFDTVLSCLAAVMDPVSRRDYADAILDSWLESSAADAADLAIYIFEVSEENSLLGRVAFARGKRNIEEALEWARGLQVAHGRTAALAHMSSLVAECDSTQIPALAARFSLLENDPFFSALASRWARRDPSAAIRWAMELPASPAKDRVMQSLAASVGAADPVLASRLIETFPLQSRESAIPSLASAWAAQDPSAALQWAQDLSEEALKKQAIEAALTVWFEKAPVAMLTWAHAQPPDQLRDGTILNIIKGLREESPDLAARLSKRFVR